MDIFSKFFHHNMDEILQKIFLLLDPDSLHCSRQICKQWNEFILNRIWGSNFARRCLKKRLKNRWMHGKPEVESCDYWDQMFVYSNSFAMDDRFLVCGLSHVGEGGAKVIERKSGNIIGTLSHKFENYRKKHVRRVAISNKFIATLSGKLLCIWDKTSMVLVTKQDLGESFLESFADMEASGDLVVVANKNYNDHVYVWKLEENILVLVAEYKNDAQVSPTFVLDSDRLGIILEYNLASVKFYDRDNLDIKETLDTEICLFDGFMTVKAYKYPHFAISQYSEVYIWHIETGSNVVYFNLGNYEMCCQILLTDDFFFINMIKDQSLWENFITGEMRPSRQLLRWYQLEDFKKVKEIKNAKDLKKANETDDSTGMSSELAQLLCNPSEIELDKQHGKEYTRDMVALDTTSVVHVADFGDAVTYYDFWTTSK